MPCSSLSTSLVCSLGGFVLALHVIRDGLTSTRLIGKGTHFARVMQPSIFSMLNVAQTHSSRLLSLIDTRPKPDRFAPRLICSFYSYVDRLTDGRDVFAQLSRDQRRS